MRPTRYFGDLERGRSNHFDALRLALALIVIFSHSYPLLLADGNRSEPFFRATGGQRTSGEVALDGFFLISGYLITASWRRSRGLVDYLRRRTLRIYPGFLVAVAFSSLVAAPLLAPDASEFWRRFDPRACLKQALGLVAAYSPDGVVNGSLWSIRYEFHCYLAVAAIGLMGLLRRRGLVVGFALFCTGLEVAIQRYGLKMPGSGLSWLWGFPEFWPRLAGCFFAGAAFHLWADRVAHSGRLAIASLAGLSLAAFLPGSRALALVMPYLGGYLIFYLAFLPATRLKDIARHGDVSYGLYLYAFPIQLLLIRQFGPRLSPEGLTILATIATAAVAALSWQFVERPFLATRRAAPILAEPVAPPGSVGTAPMTDLVS